MYVGSSAFNLLRNNLKVHESKAGRQRKSVFFTLRVWRAGGRERRSDKERGEAWWDAVLRLVGTLGLKSCMLSISTLLTIQQASLGCFCMQTMTLPPQSALDVAPRSVEAEMPQKITWSLFEENSKTSRNQSVTKRERSGRNSVLHIGRFSSYWDCQYGVSIVAEGLDFITLHSR